jgi:hypothetical protein
MRDIKKKKKESEERFTSLLQRIKKQYHPAEQQQHALSFVMERPPDEGASALGHQLALAFQELTPELAKTMQEQALVSLISPHINPSIVQSFLRTLLTSSTPTDMGWLSSWILHADKAILLETNHNDFQNWDALTAMIHCHADYVQRSLLTASDKSLVCQEIATLFRKLQSSPSQISLLREFTHVAFSTDNMNSVRAMLSPLMAATALSLKKWPHSQTILFLEGIWREAWTEMSKVVENGKQEHVMDVLFWMTESLDLYLWGIPCRSNSQDQIACKEVGQRWLIQILEMASYLVQCVDSNSKQQQKLSMWLSNLVAGTLSRLFMIVPTFRISLQPLLIQIQFIVQQLDSSAKAKFTLDATATHRLAVMILSNPIREDVRELLNILTASVETLDNHTIIPTMLRGIGSMLGRSPVCATNSAQLIQALAANEKSSKRSMKKSRSKKRLSSSSSTQSVIQLLMDDSEYDTKEVVQFLAFETPTLYSQQLSVGQQMGALLLGIGLLDTNVISTNEKSVHKYFNNLLSHYPHLGVSLLPIIVESINTASIRGDGETLLRQLNFACGTIVKDAQCASEVWNLLGTELMQPDIPATIRAAVIRLFPQICAANKRLYKRVIVALGNNLVPKSGPGNADNGDYEIRLAIAATIADLAREDRIRDVTDVIGWIQGFIEDSGWVRSVSTVDKEQSAAKAAIVHYALLCLHYLVVSQELDYTVVMVVLRKRLCDVHDMNEVLKLPPLVLETLALLLGDGECDDDEEDDQQVGIHPQIRQSVQTLIDLALAENTHPNAVKNDTAGRYALLRCRQNIYESLSRYSIGALGLDEEGIQAVCSAANNPGAPAVPDSGLRYNSIKRVIEEGIHILHDFNDSGLVNRHSNDEEDGADMSKSLVALTRKILKLEEETFGSTLWQKRSKVKPLQKSKSSDSSVESSYAQALPSSATIKEIHLKNRSTATALSTLLCVDGKPISTITSVVGDIANESSDSLLFSFSVQAWLNAARSLLMQLVATQSSSQGLDQILTEIRDWRFRLDETDNMHLALSSLALCIPDVLGPYGDHSAYVEDICNEVWIAYKEQEFGNPDIAKLCVAFAGVCYVRSNNMKRVEEIVGSLERSVTAYGGSASFGACFGLAVIAQSFPNLSHSSHSDGLDLGFTRRIVGFLLNQLVPCVKGTHKVLHSLVVCVENGSVEPDVIDALTVLRKQQLELVESKRGIVKTVFIALALCLPALASVNDELLLGIYCLLDCLPWGSGKGFALPSVLQTCRRCGLFEDAEIEKIYSNYAKIFEDGMDKGVEGLDDIFYAVTATMTRVIPHSMRRFLVGNRELFDEAGRCISLLSTVASLCSLPCLGHGATFFTDPPQLHPVVSKNDISGVSSLIIEAVGASGHDLSKYSQIAVLLMGYMASLKSSAIVTDSSVAGTIVSSKSKTDSNASQLPTPQQGTTLEILMNILTEPFNESNFEKSMGQVIPGLLNCLEVLSLPGHFAGFLEQLLEGNAMMKSCTNLLVSQIQGRPRAVFDGREYINLANRISKTPVLKLRAIFGKDESPIFLKSFGVVVSKLPSDEVEEAIEHVWRLCINEINYIPGWTMSFLSAIKTILGSDNEKTTSSISPKTLKTVKSFLLRKVFSGIRDATWTSTSASTERSIVDLYAHCLAEMPIASLVQVEFFALTDHDGFVGEALRYRCIMILVRLGYFTTPARASSEIQSALSWFSRQIVSSGDQIFSMTLLNVICSLAEATLEENAEKRKSLLLMLLDNLLLVECLASTIGLQMLGALVCQWCKGRGSDGDLSLAYVCATGMARWQDLSPSALRKMFEVVVHDLPYNLAAFSKKERIGSIVFNRLFRIYTKWLEQGADEETIGCVRKALVCCRNEDSGGDDFDYVAIAMLL